MCLIMSHCVTFCNSYLLDFENQSDSSFDICEISNSSHISWNLHYLVIIEYVWIVVMLSNFNFMNNLTWYGKY